MTDKPVETKKDLKIKVLNQVIKLADERAIDIPENYSIPNALQTAWFKIQDMKAGKSHDYKPVLEVCTPDSVVESLFKMCTEGLNPQKKQCAFILRDGKLEYQRQYQGSEALAKRYSDVISIKAQVIYKDDVYVTQRSSDGRITLKEHVSPLKNQDGEIIGAYCIIVDKDGLENLTEMTMKKIRTSWNQGAMKGNGPVHKNFEDQMAKKTVTNRACDPYITTSDDSALMDQYEKEEKQEFLQVEEIKTAPALQLSEESIKITESSEPKPEAESKEKFEAGF
jgi:recombination protein RecT